MAKLLLAVSESLVGCLFIGVHVWMIWAWMREKPMTQEEIERGDMRSVSWPYYEGGGFAGGDDAR
ncbi:MAG TPA: hypothetical protein VG273_27785 [Bryobacteraceae bacterium]|nr:hypothetical protein [Bryobacteraceae bacterium]